MRRMDGMCTSDRMEALAAPIGDRSSNLLTTFRIYSNYVIAYCTFPHLTMETSWRTLVIGALFVVIALLYFLPFRRKTLPFPPGPAGYPLVGYLKAIPGPIWKTYRDWSREYSR